MHTPGYESVTLVAKAQYCGAHSHSPALLPTRMLGLNLSRPQSTLSGRWLTASRVTQHSLGHPLPLPWAGPGLWALRWDNQGWHPGAGLPRALPILQGRLCTALWSSGPAAASLQSWEPIQRKPWLEHQEEALALLFSNSTAEKTLVWPYGFQGLR